MIKETNWRWQNWLHETWNEQASLDQAKRNAFFAMRSLSKVLQAWFVSLERTFRCFNRLWPIVLLVFIIAGASFSEINLALLHEGNSLKQPPHWATSRDILYNLWCRRHPGQASIKAVWCLMRSDRNRTFILYILFPPQWSKPLLHLALLSVYWLALRTAERRLPNNLSSIQYHYGMSN